MNRVLTDHISELRFTCTAGAIENLRKENLAKNTYFTGDPMYDAFLYYSSRASRPKRLRGLNQEWVELPEKYYYLTCHRQKNTNEKNLCEILKAMGELDYPVIYPVHLRYTIRMWRCRSKNQ